MSNYDLLIRFFKTILCSMCLLAVLLISSCDDGLPNLKLPAKTTMGLNTFGCLVNNNVWTNYGTACYTFGCSDSNLRGSLTKDAKGNHELIILADYSVRKKRLYQSINIIIPNLKATGPYYLADGDMQFIADDQNTIYKTVGPGSGLVNITRYDTINSIISGEFSGTLTFSNGTKTVKLTEGRFDLTVN